MSSYVINGGKSLEGTISISGNKNGALACLAATLLSDESITLHNIPKIEDVKVMIKLLESLGSSVSWIADNSVKVQTNLDTTKQIALNDDLVASIRASILLLGPLVRASKVILPPPGGDVIGFRRLDTHIIALEALGARCTVEEAGYLVVQRESALKGAKVYLDETSVTATENVVMASVLAEGTSTILNSASEPHVQDLCNLLVAMGSKISGIGSNLLTIEGVSKLKGATYTIGSDYMEMGSFIGLAAATNSEFILKNIEKEHLPMITKPFERLGVGWQLLDNSTLLVPKNQKRVIQKTFSGQTHKIEDAPWPGFPADLLSIITVVATQMKGTILIHEKMYEARMFFIDWLIRMGSDIILCDPHRALVNGPKKLQGIELASPDIRAAMALVIAALSAQGTSTIQNIYQLERGYENLEEKLVGVGADITKVS